MPTKKSKKVQVPNPRVPGDVAALLRLSDDDLVDAIQRRTFRYFWEGAHPVSGLAYDRRLLEGEHADHVVTVGGSGMGIMALVVGVERRWITRAMALERLDRMLTALWAATSYHGAWAHFLDGRTGATVPFSRKDDGGDLVETSFLVQGLLCARQYFSRDTDEERKTRARIDALCDDVEWTWYTQDRNLLYWHWSPNNGWATDHEIRGWNECLVTYVLAAGSRRNAVSPEVYHRGFASGRAFLNGRHWHGIELPLGPKYGGPLFFAHYSFLGLDPRGLSDRYADYGEQCVRHVQINRQHCLVNPDKHRGYGSDCWGLTASDDPRGYDAHSPDNDNGTISPTAAASSLPYAPKEVLQAIRGMLSRHGDRVWGRFGFVDAFNEGQGWFAKTFLAIDQGPIVVMMENHRSGLLWKLFMSAPEVREGLRRLGFSSPYLADATKTKR